MRVAIDTGFESSGHSVRGIGVHTSELLIAFRGLKYEDIEILGVDFSKEDLSKYDLVHFPYWSPFFLTLPPQKPAKKVIVTIHDLIPLIYPDHYPPGLKGRLNLLRQKARLTYADMIITISETSKKDICRFLKTAPDKVRVVYLAPKKIFHKAVDTPLLHSIGKKYKLPSQFVLYVGDINYNKNITTLVEASKRAGVPLIIVGKNALKIEKLAETNHVEHKHLKGLDLKNVYRLGFVPDSELAALYRLATVFCQPSYYEGFGLGILEAQSAGCPVAASKTQSLVEVAENSVLFADPKNPSDFADKIWLLANDNKLREQLIKKGKENASKYSWKKTAAETLDVYKKVLNA